jgi:hypothetical protein
MNDFHSMHRWGSGLVLVTLAAASFDASAAQLLFQTRGDGKAITADAIKSGGDMSVDREIADDFIASGTIERVVLYGYDCFNCVGASSTGVNVRLYDTAQDGSPGNLLHEFHYAADDPRFRHDINRTGHESTVDISFPEAYAVDGTYFLSVQLEYAGAATWPLWSAETDAPLGQAFYQRDRLSAGAWVHGPSNTGPFANHDLWFEMYGTPPGPPPSRVVAGCGEFSVVPAPLPEGAENATLRAVKAFGPNEAWAVGDFERTVQGSVQSYSLAMHYANGAWSIVPTPSPSVCPTCTQVFVSAIDGRAPNDIWASGWKRAYTQDHFLGGELFVMHYDGTTWSEVPTLVTDGASGAWTRGIQVLGENDVWFVGDWVGPSSWGSMSQVALAMRWNGSTFTQYETPNPPGGTPGWSLYAVSGTKNNLWAVGEGSDGDDAPNTYFAHWNGTAWQLSQPPLPGDYKQFQHLLTLAPDRVYAGGQGLTIGTGYFGMIAKFDGSNWNLEPTGGLGGGAMASFGPNSVLSLGSPPIYFDGSTWTPQPEPPNVLGSLLDIAATGPCNAWIVGVERVAAVKRPLLVQLRPIIFNTSFE